MTNPTSGHTTTSRAVAKKDEARSDENLRRILSYQLVAKHLTEARKELIAQARLEAGERLEITTPWGAKLGTLSRGQTSQEVRLDDEAAVLPDAAEDEIELFIADEQAAIAILEEHAPHLLGARLTAAGLGRLGAEAKKQWQKTGKAPTGWRIVDKTPTARATAANLAKELAAEALAGPIDNVLQIEAAEEE